MEDTVSSPIPEQRSRPKRRLQVFTWLRENPVIIKELRARMRGNRAFILLSVYLLIMVIILSLVYIAFITSNNTSNSYNYASSAIIEQRQTLGKMIFWFVVGVELFAICAFAPALTSSAITSEREQQTLDLLKTTLLSARSLVYGKFLSGFVFVLLMLLTSLPLQSLAFLFGGVGPEEVMIMALILVCTAASFCAAGVFSSSLFKSSRMSNGAAYAAPLIYVLLLPAFLLILLAILNTPFSNLSRNHQTIFEIIGWLMISLNPIATIIATEALIVESHAVWFHQMYISGGTNIQMPSPWILYCLLALLLAGVLLTWSSRLVQRMDT